MELTKIELISIKENFNIFQFVLHYDNSSIHILKYTCKGVDSIFGNLVESYYGYL